MRTIASTIAVGSLLAIMLAPLSSGAEGDVEWNASLTNYVKDISDSGSTWVRPQTEHGTVIVTLDGDGVQQVYNNGVPYQAKTCSFPDDNDLTYLTFCQIDHGSSLNKSGLNCITIVATAMTVEDQDPAEASWPYGNC